MQPLVSIIILSYNSRPFIELCVETILGQTHKNLEIFIVINGSTDGSAEVIKEKFGQHPLIKIIEPGRNLWFSKGNNLAIKQSRGEYVIAWNQDTVAEADFVERLVKKLESDQNLGSASGKLLHYDYSRNQKTKIIDSTGIEIYKTRKVIDRGQWEDDNGQYDGIRHIFGPSGAAAIYRRSALEDVTHIKPDGDVEYYDDDFIAYKEDVDLAWRLQLSGHRSAYVPEAVLYHGRTVGRSWPSKLIQFILNRRRQSRIVRKQSFKNHYLMMVKNEIPSLFFRHFFHILIREILLLSYSVVFEPFQFFAIVQFFRELPIALHKRRQVMAKRRAGARELLPLFK